MATCALIHGAGDSGFHWHLLGPELRGCGHEVIAMDLPCEDESAGLAEYADAAVAAIGARAPVTVVAKPMRPALSRPHELAARFEAYRRELGLQ